MEKNKIDKFLNITLNLKDISIIAVILIAIVLTFSTFVDIDAFAEKHKMLEKDYQKIWCAENLGKTEIKMPDGTRCDCITNTNAIEFDFAYKWYEATGQALWYSYQTNKRGGIVLILEAKEDKEYWIKLNSMVMFFNLPIDTWKIENF